LGRRLVRTFAETESVAIRLARQIADGIVAELSVIERCKMKVRHLARQGSARPRRRSRSSSCLAAALWSFRWCCLHRRHLPIFRGKMGRTRRGMRLKHPRSCLRP